MERDKLGIEKERPRRPSVKEKLELQQYRLDLIRQVGYRVMLVLGGQKSL